MSNHDKNEANDAKLRKLFDEISYVTGLLKSYKEGTMCENGASAPNSTTVRPPSKPVSSYQYKVRPNQMTYYGNSFPRFNGSRNPQLYQNRRKFTFRPQNMKLNNTVLQSKSTRGVTVQASSAKLPDTSSAGLTKESETSKYFNSGGLSKVNPHTSSLLNKQKNMSVVSSNCEASVGTAAVTIASTARDTQSVLLTSNKIPFSQNAENKLQNSLEDGVSRESTAVSKSNPTESICILSNAKVPFVANPPENTDVSLNKQVLCMDGKNADSYKKELVQLNSQLSIVKNVPPTENDERSSTQFLDTICKENNVSNENSILITGLKTVCGVSKATLHSSSINKPLTSKLGHLTSCKPNLSKFKYVSNNVLPEKCHQANKGNSSSLKPVYNHSKRLVTSTYKVVNKNSPCHVKNFNNQVMETKSADVPSAVNKQTVTPKPKVFTSHRPFESRKVSSVSLKKGTPQSMRKIIKTKYKIVNRKKSPYSASTKATNILSRSIIAKSLLLSRIKGVYPVANSEAAPEKPSTTENSVSPKVLADIKNCDQKVIFDETNASKAVNKKLNFKKQSDVISNLNKHKKYTKKNPNSKSFDLTNLSPEELVSLDRGSLLKLSAMVTSSQPKQKSFIKKTKYKIVSKRKSLPGSSKKRIPAWKSGNFGMQNTIKLHQPGQRNKNYKYNKQYSLNVDGKKRKLILENQHNESRYQNMITIGDINYKVSRTKLSKKKFPNQQKSTVVVVRGVRFQMDPSGKSLKKLPAHKNENTTPLKRVDLGGKTYIGTSPDILTEIPSSQVRNLATRVLHRSIQTAVAATAKKSQNENKYCMFYNRFGKCNRQSDCPYIHDPSKIAVCTRFLRGTCKVDNCPFSHERNPGKMAICSFYIQGACTVKECPYRHEKLEPNAELCQDFVRGYCALAGECKKAHILICPQFLQGKCDRELCPYPHPPRKEKRKLEETEEENLKKMSDTANEKPEKEDDFRYFKISTTQVDSAKGIYSSVHEGCTWVGQDAPVLPKYIPLVFDDDVECLMN